MLEQGIGQLFGTGYRIEARRLQIIAAEPSASARVTLTAGTHVLVASLRGRLRITNARGTVGPIKPPAGALNFEPQADAPRRITSHGVLLQEGKKFFLTEDH